MSRATSQSPPTVQPGLSDERRIVASVAVSALGTWSYNVGIAVYAYQETGSTAWVAAATVGRYVPALLITWVGSRFTDRLPRRSLAVGADLVCALVMLLLTVTAALHGPIPLAIALAAVSSGAARIQSASALAVAADVVSESRLPRTAGLLSGAEAVAVAAGPAVASLLLAVSAPPVLFAVNGLTFVASAILLRRLRDVPPRPAHERPGGGGLTHPDVRAALRGVRPLLVVRTTVAFVYGVDIVLLAVIATDNLDIGTGGYGWLLAGAGLGGLVCAWWIRRDGGGGPATAPSIVGLALYTLPLLAYLAIDTLGGGLLVQAVRGFGCVLATATAVSALQRSVPSAVSGRVLSATHMLVMVGTSAGALVTPVLLSVWGLPATLGAVVLVAVVAAAVVVPALAHFDRRGAESLAALDPRVDLLRRLAIFHDASRATLYEVADSLDESEVPAGAPILVEGEHADRLVVLVAGSVEVATGSGDARRSLRTMHAPAYVGEIGLLHGIPRTATVTAAQPCRLWSLPAETFLGAVSQAGVSSALTENVRVRLS
ncbi:MAG: MFS transporter [Frankiales bacterium]|nr:MFS transporter [Frankiales bacterium]